MVSVMPLKSESSKACHIATLVHGSVTWSMELWPARKQYIRLRHGPPDTNNEIQSIKQWRVDVHPVRRHYKVSLSGEAIA